MFVDLKTSTRYGASPAWRNTFLNMQPLNNSPMFLSESDRFSKDPHAREHFQHEEKSKKENFMVAKLDKIRTHQELFQKKVNQEYELSQLKEMNNQKTKYYALDAYEQVSFN